MAIARGRVSSLDSYHDNILHTTTGEIVPLSYYTPVGNSHLPAISDPSSSSSGGGGGGAADSHSVLNFKASYYESSSSNNNFLKYSSMLSFDQSGSTDVLEEEYAGMFMDGFDGSEHLDHKYGMENSNSSCSKDGIRHQQQQDRGEGEELLEGAIRKRPRHPTESDVEHVQPASKKQCNGSNRKAKNKIIATKDPQSIAAKNRRERISERLKILQDLVPNGTKVDLVTMLEKAISYVKFLQLQVKVLATDEFWPSQSGKAPDVSQVKEAIDAILLSQRN